MTKREYLLKTGHNTGGLCRKCWDEAGSHYADGQSEHESKYNAYLEVVAQYNREATEKVVSET